MSRSRFKPETQMYWIRVALGALIGALHAFFWRPPLSIITSFSTVVSIYLLTYYFFRKIYEGKLEDEKASWKEGIGSFFLAWLFSWFLLYNTLFPSA
jgi:fatty acid desaturase